MKTSLRHLSVALVATLAFGASAVHAQQPSAARASAPATGAEPAQAAPASLAAQVPGTWREQTGGQSLIVFSADGGFKLLLRKGEMANFRSVDGKWLVQSGNKIQISVEVDGKVVTSSTMKLVFRDGEMIFVGDDGRETRHRRHEGALPAEYVW